MYQARGHDYAYDMKEQSPRILTDSWGTLEIEGLG